MYSCVGVVVPMIDAAISYDAVSSGNPVGPFKSLEVYHIDVCRHP